MYTHYTYIVFSNIDWVGCIRAEMWHHINDWFPREYVEQITKI